MEVVVVLVVAVEEEEEDCGGAAAAATASAKADVKRAQPTEHATHAVVQLLLQHLSASAALVHGGFSTHGKYSAFVLSLLRICHSPCIRHAFRRNHNAPFCNYRRIPPLLLIFPSK